MNIQVERKNRSPPHSTKFSSTQSNACGVTAPSCDDSPCEPPAEFIYFHHFYLPSKRQKNIIYYCCHFFGVFGLFMGGSISVSLEKEFVGVPPPHNGSFCRSKHFHKPATSAGISRISKKRNTHGSKKKI